MQTVASLRLERGNGPGTILFVMTTCIELLFSKCLRTTLTISGALHVSFIAIALDLCSSFFLSMDIVTRIHFPFMISRVLPNYSYLSWKLK